MISCMQYYMFLISCVAVLGEEMVYGMRPADQMHRRAVCSAPLCYSNANVHYAQTCLALLVLPCYCSSSAVYVACFLQGIFKMALTTDEE